jgi:hypothetical protein
VSHFEVRLYFAPQATGMRVFELTVSAALGVNVAIAPASWESVAAG